MSAPTPALAAVIQAGIAYRVHEHAHERDASSWGSEAAAALGVDPARVFKTLVVDTTGALVVAVVPVLSALDLKALARVAGCKHARLAVQLAAERAMGYVVGGISPVGQKQQLPTFVDESARDLDSIYVSGGRRGLELELGPDDLVALTRGRYAAIARDGPRA